MKKFNEIDENVNLERDVKEKRWCHKDEEKWIIYQIDEIGEILKVLFRGGSVE